MIFRVSKDFKKQIFFLETIGKSAELEIYRNTKAVSREKISEITRQVKEITESAWDDPGELVNKWLELADIIIIVKCDNHPSAFAIGSYVDYDIVSLVSTMVRPSLQNSGLSTHLNGLIIKNHFLTRFRFRRALKIFAPIYFVFRTPNPTLYASVNKKFSLFPSVSYREPSAKEIKVFNLIVKKFLADARVDRKTFVIKGAYSLYPNLIYKDKEIPWSKNETINNFFEKNLRLTKHEGNTMVVLGKISPLNFIRL